MSWEAWLVFASFWAIFVTTPGPNAVNCISVAIAYGFRLSLVCVLGILTQATLFITLSAFGITALIAAPNSVFFTFKWISAGFLIYLGIRGWLTAHCLIAHQLPKPEQIYVKAFWVATINPKSLAGYLAAFSQFVAPDLPMGEQIWVIFPTALCLTTLSYVTFCALGAFLGRAALSGILNIWLRRILAVCFIGYGFFLGLSPVPKGE